MASLTVQGSVSDRQKSDTCDSSHSAGWASVFLGTTAFLSAFLLFLVQPLIVKRIIPWFGGGTSVWNGSMLFFQSVLFLGYLYAHLLGRGSPRLWKVALHVGLLVLAVALLPIDPDPSFKDGDPAWPLYRLIMLLLESVGLPYFLLSSTAPLVQVWHARLRPERSPYRLYALSNAGSLLALLGYPIVVEPTMGLRLQARTWSAAFAIFAVLSALGMAAWRRSRGVAADAGPARGAQRDRGVSGTMRPAAKEWILWLLLPACASMLLLAVTNYICQDVASVPMLWIAPLALYLISFILTFDSDYWYRRWIFIPLFALACLESLHCWIVGPLMSIFVQLGSHLVLMFAASMICHGELVRLRPAPRYLTAFYLAVSAGGALGGMFVNLAAPVIFVDHHELPVGIAMCWLLAAGVLVVDPSLRWLGMFRLPVGVAAAFTLILYFAVLYGYFEGQLDSVLAIRRNFYGVLKVKEKESHDPWLHRWELYHGRISHGMQMRHEERRLLPAEYYDELSGVGWAMRATQDRPERRIGLVGLGAGMITAYGRPGEYIRIYEINPLVIELSRGFFTYLESCQCPVDIVLGDARISLERESPQNFDVLVLDAFSGDSIPVHLLTEDAAAIFLRHLAPEGILAVHISNIHLDLTPVMRGWVERFQLHGQYVESQTDAERAAISSSWFLLRRGKEPLAGLEFPLEQASIDHRLPGTVHWTDDFSSIWSVVRTDGLVYFAE